MRLRFAVRVSGVCIIVLVLAGCGEEVKMADVSGEVTFDGAPVEKGAITFFPTDGQSPTAGDKIEEGEYATRVPIGRMKVLMSAPKFAYMKKQYSTKESRERPVYSEGLPAKYSDLMKTELEFEVQPGANRKDFHLTSK